jgi:hypothetical protein
MFWKKHIINHFRSSLKIIEIEAKSIPPTHIQYMTRSNRKIVVRGTIDTPYTHMHGRSLFWPGTVTPIKHKLVLVANTFTLSLTNIAVLFVYWKLCVSWAWLIIHDLCFGTDLGTVQTGWCCLFFILLQ